jgi:hypothetical protein
VFDVRVEDDEDGLYAVEDEVDDEARQERPVRARMSVSTKLRRRMVAMTP